MRTKSTKGMTKLYIFLFASLLASLATPLKASSCPKLAGTWTCTDSRGQGFEQTVTESTASRVTAYEFSDGEYSARYQADGIEYPYGVDGYQGTTKSTCTAAGELSVLIRLSRPSYSEQSILYRLTDANHMEANYSYADSSGVLRSFVRCEKTN